MGSNDFRKGLTAFLRKYSFKTAVTEDLLHELTLASAQNLNMSAIMGTWTRQKGYPVIIVEKKGMEYVLRQERFLASSNTSDIASPYDYKWEVPISYTTSENVQAVQRSWLHIHDEQLVL